ncbi:MAG: response regulator [Acidobacteria bacterium]|nr:response regulator [Acidobacteriota bacterium]
MSRIRVLLVDESETLVSGLQAWFDGDPLIEVVGAASAVPEALEQVKSLHPDLVLLDAHTPPAGGFDAARRIKQVLPAPLVVLASFHSNEAARQAAAQAGADRFLPKSEVLEGLSTIARELLEIRRAADSPLSETSGPQSQSFKKKERERS